MAVAAAFRGACFHYRRSLLCAVMETEASCFWQVSSALPSVAARCQPFAQRSLSVSQCTAFHTAAVACAGHNKWSKVKNVKGPKDAARSRMFMKFSMVIRHAVKEGGPNPDFNIQLANIIEQCRAHNMPKASIEAAIKGAEKSKAATYALYEGRGPGGSSLLIEVLTDNSTRSYQELKRIASKNGGILCEGARHCFDKKGVVTVNGLDRENQAVQLDQALEVAIEAGAEDVKQTEDEEEKPVLKFICDLPTLRTVREKLDSMGMQTVSVGPEFIPNTMVQLLDTELETASRLIEVINDYSDVLRVYDNIESQS